MGCLPDSIPKLTRSSLDRCLERQGISRQPASEQQIAKRGKFTETKIGYAHMDSCELHHAGGKLHTCRPSIGCQGPAMENTLPKSSLTHGQPTRQSS